MGDLVLTEKEIHGVMQALLAGGVQQTALHNHLRGESPHVNPVLRALESNGIEVTAIHSHMLDDSPHLFFMHFWGNNDALAIARGLRAALDVTK